MQKRKGNTEKTTIGNSRRRTKKSVDLSGTAVTCVLNADPSACEAVKSRDWKNYLDVFLKDDKLSISASLKVRECYNEVELEDEGRINIAQDILRKSTGFSRRVIAPCDGVGGVTLSNV